MNSEDVGLIARTLSSKFSNLCDPDPPTSQTDERTDRRQCNRNIALCTIVHRAIKTVKPKTWTDVGFLNEAIFQP